MDAVAAPPADDQTAKPDDGQLPKHPPVPGRIRQRVEALWKETNSVPDFERAVAAWRECQKSLYPSWFDRTDAFRGLTPQELHTRETDRKVRVNYCYRNVQQTVAMMVPDDHDFEWEQVPEIGQELASDETLARFALTLKAVTKAHTDEIRFQDTLQGYVQDAVSFRIAVMKVTYDASFLDAPVQITQDNQDMQPNVQRLRVLVEDYTRRVFTDSDSRFEEMMELKDSLGVEGELKAWAGLRCENVPLDCIRWDTTIRDLERIHLAGWISHDVLMSVDEIRAKYPFKMNADGETWTGVHPDDLDRTQQGTRDRNKPLGDTFWSTQTMTGAGTSAQAAPQSERQADRLLVREIWSRRDTRVHVLVEGIEYFVQSYVPPRQPSCWYPFRFYRFNRVTGTVYGISDIELQRDIQNRVNQKKSDEEKARWLSLPRGIYNTQSIDETEVVKVKDINPGEWRGINLQGQKPEDVFMALEYEYKPESFDTQKDEQDMRQMANIPEQMQGVTGRANFAIEVQAAQTGSAISSASRTSNFRRELEATYHHLAEVLVMEVDEATVKKDHGAGAFWPQVYGEAEGAAILKQLTEQAEQQFDLQAQAASDQAAAQGGAAQAPNPDQRASAIQQAVEQQCMQQYGFPEPVTREVLFRRLRCKVTVAINAQADRAAQGQSIMQLFQAIQSGGMAAQAAGMTFDPKPLLKMAGKPEWAAMFTRDPGQILGNFMAVAQQNAGSIPPQLALQVMQVLQPYAAQAIAQQQAAAAQQAQAAGGAPPAQ